VEGAVDLGVEVAEVSAEGEVLSAAEAQAEDGKLLFYH
jgi:hypothetical protein